MEHQITSRGSLDWESPHLQIILRGEFSTKWLLFFVAKQLSKNYPQCNMRFKAMDTKAVTTQSLRSLVETFKQNFGITFQVEVWSRF